VAIDGQADPKVLLQDISLELTEQRIGVIGANGSGKSTLLRMLNGLVAPTAGSVAVNGADTVRNVRAVRQQVGFVFTDPLSQLVMPTGREDVELSLRRSVRNGKERREQATAALDRFGLLPLADQSIYELSGGERQLLALASVLAVDPDVLVLDEPSTLLDLRNRELLRRTVAGLSQQVVMSTHDLELVLDMDRVLVVESGQIAYDGGAAAAVVDGDEAADGDFADALAEEAAEVAGDAGAALVAEPDPVGAGVALPEAGVEAAAEEPVAGDSGCAGPGVQAARADRPAADSSKRATARRLGRWPDATPAEGPVEQLPHTGARPFSAASGGRSGPLPW